DARNPRSDSRSPRAHRRRAARPRPGPTTTRVARDRSGWWHRPRSPGGRRGRETAALRSSVDDSTRRRNAAHDRGSVTMADIGGSTEDRLLVCVSPSPASAGLVHSANRMATSLHARWFAVYVELPGMAMLSEAARGRAADHLRLAAELGAKTVTLAGRNVAEEIARFARQWNVTKIIVGKPRHSLARRILSRNPVDRLVRISGDVDVYVVAGEPGEPRETAYVIRPEPIPLSDYGAAILYLILATLACFAMYPYFHLSNLIIV